MLRILSPHKSNILTFVSANIIFKYFSHYSPCNNNQIPNITNIYIVYYTIKQNFKVFPNKKGNLHTFCNRITFYLITIKKRGVKPNKQKTVEIPNLTLSTVISTLGNRKTHKHSERLFIANKMLKLMFLILIWLWIKIY